MVRALVWGGSRGVASAVGPVAGLSLALLAHIVLLDHTTEHKHTELHWQKLMQFS